MISARASFAAIALLLTPSFTAAETIIYQHDDKPLFSITFPAGWFVDTDFLDEAKDAGVDEPEIRIVEAMPGDGTKLWFGTWVVPRASTLNRGLEYLASLDGHLFTDVEASTPADVELGGMPAKTFYGTARRQGEEVEYAVALFEARPEVITVALYVGRPQTWGKHREQLSRVVDSVVPVGD